MPEQRKAEFGVLAGVRVLDLTQHMAGPFCTQLLADHGADVVKVETAAGDTTRRSGPFHPEDGERVQSGYFNSINRNKRSIVIDLKSAAGRNLLLDMLSGFDVIVENFRAGVMGRLGLSFESLHERHPRLVYATLRGFGDPRSGASPYEDWPAFDVVAQAMGGIMSVTGPDKDHPTKVGPGIGDMIPALYLAFGIVSAVLHARQSGTGQFVDIAMVDSILAVSERIVHQRSFGKAVPRGEGNHHPLAAPFGIFAAADGHVAIGASDDIFFGRLCTLLDVEALARTARFAHAGDRAQNRQQLIADLENVTRSFSKAELKSRLGGHVPFGIVYDMNDIADDPHFAAREMLVEVEIPGISEKLAIAGVPLKFSSTPGGVARRAPVLGEHTDDVLTGAGFSAAQIGNWRTAGVVG